MTKLYKNVYICTGPLYLPKQEADGKMYVKYEVRSVMRLEASRGVATSSIWIHLKQKFKNIPTKSGKMLPCKILFFIS